MQNASGNVSYPNIYAFSSFEFTDLSGISPASASMEVFPQFGIPDANGDITIDYVDQYGTSYQIILRNMHIDAASYERNAGGQIVRVMFLDERWKWSFGEISGRYNVRFVKCYDAAFTSGAATEFVDPRFEKTPQQLAMLCIHAMGYADNQWDISRLPNLSRPEVDWDYANPAQELNKICDDLGCRIVPIRSAVETGLAFWKIVVTGDPDSATGLPDNYPYQDPGSGIDPAEKPDYLKIVTAPWLFEARIPLEHVGKELDETLRALPDLSYNPFAFEGLDDEAQGFEKSFPEFTNVSNVRQQQPDSTLISPRECAQSSIYRILKIKGSASSIKAARPAGTDPPDDQLILIPGLDKIGSNSGSVAVERIVLTDNLVQPFIENGATSAEQLKAYIEGTFWFNRRISVDSNYPLGSRIDLAGKAETTFDIEQSVSFGISNSEDSRFALIQLSQLVAKYKSTPDIDPGTGKPIDSYMYPSQLFLHTAVKIRDKDSWQPIRDSRSRFLGDGPDPRSSNPTSSDSVRTATVLSIIKDDIQPWTRAVYNADGSQAGPPINNQDLVDKQCKYYLDSIQKTFETVNNETRTYCGIFPIDMDGSIQQVSWRVSSAGWDTVASLNTEHDFDIPKYDARKARDARKSPENKEARAAELLREARQRGTEI